VFSRLRGLGECPDEGPFVKELPATYLVRAGIEKLPRAAGRVSGRPIACGQAVGQVEGFPQPERAGGGVLHQIPYAREGVQNPSRTGSGSGSAVS